MAQTVGAHIRRLVRHSAVYGIGHILTRSLGFLLLPLYTNTIPTAEYGKAALVFSFLAIMNVFYGYGMDVAFLRYVALQDDERKQKELFSTGFLSILISSTVFSLFLLLFVRQVSLGVFGTPNEETLIRFAAGILFFDALGLMPFMALRAKEKSVPFTLLKLANVTINVAANVLFIVGLHEGVVGIFKANLLASGLTFLLLAPVWGKFFIPRFDRRIYREMLRFGLPYIPSGLAVVIMDLIDRFLLERMTDLSTTGIYSAGYKLGMFMALFIAAFRFAWHPFFLSTSRQPNAKRVFARVLTYFVLACSAVFLVISLFIGEIVRFRIFGYTLFGESYWGGTRIVPLILISYVFYGVYVNFLVGVYLEKKTHWLPAITGISAGVNVLANLLLIPRIGMMGSAWATVLAYATMAVLLYRRVSRIYPVAYEWGRVAKAASGALFLFLAQEYVFAFRSPLLKLVLILSYPVLLVLLGFLDREEKRRLRALVMGGER